MIWKNENIVPTLNVESFGVKNETYGHGVSISTYYIASLSYNNVGLFNKTMVYYLPLLFKSEEDIRNVMKFYDSIYFCISGTTMQFNKYNSSQHHISEFKDIKDIVKHTPSLKSFDIVFYINYKGRAIYLIRETYNTNPNLFINNFVCKEEDSNEYLKIIIKHYREVPRHIGYSVAKYGAFTKTNIPLGDFQKILEEIDEEVDKEKKIDEEINSIYSKKTFKLVEE